MLHQASIYGIAAGYCMPASLLSIINKWAVMKFPYPGALTALQYFTSTLGVLLCGCLNVLHHDRFGPAVLSEESAVRESCCQILFLFIVWSLFGKLSCMTIVSCQKNLLSEESAVISWAKQSREIPTRRHNFLSSLFTNSELLLQANVDTFIVFRSVVPIFVAVGETLFLKQPWPSPSTWLSLTTIFAGSLIYVLTDYQFNLTAYSWAAAYLLSMSVDFVYINQR